MAAGHCMRVCAYIKDIFKDNFGIKLCFLVKIAEDGEVPCQTILNKFPKSVDLLMNVFD